MEAFPFESISSKCQQRILEKLDFAELIAMEETSKSLSIMVKNLEIKPILYATYVAVFDNETLEFDEKKIPLFKLKDADYRLSTSFLSFLGNINDAICDQLISYFDQGLILPDIDTVQSNWFLICTKEKLQAVLLRVNPKKISTCCRRRDDYGSCFALPRLEELSVHENYCLKIRDEELLAIPAKRMTLYSIESLTVEGIKGFIRQWLAGEREIEKIILYYFEWISNQFFRDLQAKFVWSSETHGESEIGFIPLDELSELDGKSFFSWIRSDGKSLNCYQKEEYFELKTTGDIQGLLYSQMTPENHIRLLGYCNYCTTKYNCFHTKTVHRKKK